MRVEDLRLHLATRPVDFRKQMDGLAIEIGRSLGADPMNGDVFIFFNRRRTGLKAVWWSRNGFTLLYKRLETGCFAVPEVREGETEVELPVAVLQAVLDGISTRLN